MAKAICHKRYISNLIESSNCLIERERRSLKQLATVERRVYDRGASSSALQPGLLRMHLSGILFMAGLR